MSRSRGGTQSAPVRGYRSRKSQFPGFVGPNSAGQTEPTEAWLTDSICLVAEAVPSFSIHLPRGKKTRSLYFPPVRNPAREKESLTLELGSQSLHDPRKLCNPLPENKPQADDRERALETSSARR